MKIKYKPITFQFAKQLRKELTPWERKLWFGFVRDYPIKIYRQKPVDSYILDFYCTKAKVAIELDGSGHYQNNQSQVDEKRTEKLNRLGILVLRYTNLDIDKRFKEVCEDIDRVIRGRTPQSAKPPAPLV